MLGHSKLSPRKTIAGNSGYSQDVSVLPFDDVAAWQFGQLYGRLKRVGIGVNIADLMIASIALVHNLTLVTHNTADFRNIPGLRLDDWLIP